MLQLCLTEKWGRRVFWNGGRLNGGHNIYVYRNLTTLID